MSFTLLFAGRLRDFKGNPFTTETPYGKAVVASIGDVFEERDVLAEALEKIAAGGIPDVEDFAQDALDRAAKPAKGS